MSDDLFPSSPIPAAPKPDENPQKPVNPGNSRYFPEVLAHKALARFLDPPPKGPTLTFQLNPDIDDTTPLGAPKNPDGVSQHPLKSPNLSPHSQ
jgi:hypothetical protein